MGNCEKGPPKKDDTTDDRDETGINKKKRIRVVKIKVET
jgi:hypothetical protein